MSKMKSESASTGLEWLSQDLGVGRVTIDDLENHLGHSFRIKVGEMYPRQATGNPLIAAGFMVTREHIERWRNRGLGEVGLVVVLIADKVHENRVQSMFETAVNHWEEKMAEEERLAKEKSEALAKKMVQVYRRCDSLLQACSGDKSLMNGKIKLDPEIVSRLKLIGDDLEALESIVGEAIDKLLNDGDTSVFQKIEGFIPPETGQAKGAILTALDGLYCAYEFNLIYEEEGGNFGYGDLTLFRRPELIGVFLAGFMAGIIQPLELAAEISRQVCFHKPKLPEVSRLILDSQHIEWMSRFIYRINNDDGLVERVPANQVRSGLALALAREFNLKLNAEKERLGEEFNSGVASKNVLEELAARYDIPASYGYDINLHLYKGLPLYVYMLAALCNTRPEAVPAGAIVKFGKKRSAPTEGIAAGRPFDSKVAKGSSARYLLDGGLAISLGDEQGDPLGPYLHLGWREGLDGRIAVLPMPGSPQALTTPSLDAKKMLALGWGLNRDIFSPKRRRIVGFVDRTTYSEIYTLFKEVISRVKEFLLSQRKERRSQVNNLTV